MEYVVYFKLEGASYVAHPIVGVFETEELARKEADRRNGLEFPVI